MFHQRIKSWICLKSTQKRLLKNVQDGIPSPLGNQEIQKTKMGTILRDTLYFQCLNAVEMQTEVC